VFGSVTAGQDIVRRIESVETGVGDKPLVPVVIADCGQLSEAGSDNESTVTRAGSTEHADTPAAVPAAATSQQ
jgi:hypothetical protein